MLVLRMNRVGKKNQAYFRLAVQEKTLAPGGRHVEMLGSWDPHQKKAVLKKERILFWIGQGAQPSDTVYNLLVSQGVLEGKKRSLGKGKQEAEKTDACTTEETAGKQEEVSSSKEESASEEKKVEV